MIASVLRDASTAKAANFTNLASEEQHKSSTPYATTAVHICSAFAPKILQKHALKQSREQKW